MHSLLLNVLVAGSSGGGGSHNSFVPILILVGLFLAAYLLFIRPARNRQMQAAAAKRQVTVGDEIITTSGLIANVVEVTDDYLTLEIAPGVHARYVPAAILRVNADEPEPDASAADTEHDVTNHEVIEAPDGDDSGSAPSDTPDSPNHDS